MSITPASPVPIVLVVDDEHHVRQMMARALEQYGYRVIAAEDGEAAWELLQAGATVHAVVTDIAMPRMTGLELAAKVATLADAPPVIIVSGFRHDTVVPQYPFLPKPFGPDQLAGMVNQLLGVAGSPNLLH